MNKLLEQQITKIFGRATKLPKEYLALLDTISNTYDDFEKKQKTKLIIKGLNSIIENSDRSIFSVDNKYKILSLNKQFIKNTVALTGLKPTIGDNFFLKEAGIPLITEWKTYIDKALKGKQFKIETKYKINNVLHYVEASFNPIKEKNDVIGVVCFSRNITKEKIANKQLKENEKKYRYLFDQNPLPMWVTDEDTNQFIDVNEAAINHYGYSKKDFLSMNALDIRPEADKNKFLGLTKAKRDILNHVGTWRHIKKDGTIIFAEINVHPIKYEGKKAQLVLSTDVTKRTIAEERVKKSEALMAHAQEIAHFGSWEMELINTKEVLKNPLIWSDEAYRIFGYKPGSIKVSNALFYKAIPVEDIFLINEALRKTIEEDAAYSIEHRIIRPNGEMRWVKEDAELVIDGNTGKLIKIVGTVQDITNRKLAEIALIENEKRYRLVSENPLVGITWVSAMGRFTEVNDTFIRMLGYTNEELIGKYFYELSIPEEQDDSISILKKMVNNEIDSFQVEKRYLKKNNELIWAEVNITSIKGATGHVNYFIAIIKDITSRKEAEIQLKQSNNRYKLATKATNDAIWDWNLSTNELYWSEGYEKLFGYEYHKESANMSTWTGRIHPDDAGRVINGIQSKIKNSSNDFWHDEYRYLKANGSIAFVYDRGYVVFDEDKKPIRMVGAMRDITKEKYLTEERAKITNDMMGRNKALEQFAYIISHNLRAPVANIIGLGSILQNNIVLSESERDKCVDGLLVSVKKLDEVITDLNYILQVRREVNEKKQMVHFADLINDVKNSISTLIEKENVTFNLNFEVTEMFSIKSYLYSIFFNIISNSIKYRKAEIEPVIQIETRKTNKKIYIIYKDNGLGIDLKVHRDKIFGLYKKFHMHAEGKGMGLYMVKTQVEILGGKISIESEVDNGVEFMIEFDI